MRAKRLIWKLSPPLIIGILLPLLVSTWYTVYHFEDIYLQQVQTHLEAQVRVMGLQIQPHLSTSNSQQIDQLAKDLGQLTQTRVTIISKEGDVLGDSNLLPKMMENHANRPEIQEALKFNTPISKIRFSHTLQTTMMYMAYPITQKEKDQAVLRISVPLSKLQRMSSSIYLKLFVTCIFLATLILLYSLWSSKAIEVPLRQMKESAELYAQGSFEKRLYISSGSKEIVDLAKALNKMAALLSERIQTIMEQRNEQNAILSSMTEGVLAVDPEHRVINFNDAAAELLDFPPEDTIGTQLNEIVRNIDLQKFINLALESDTILEEEIALYGTEQLIQTIGTTLKDASGDRIGALVVLNDITHLRKLESIRKEFVANVSHELKTPIASIKGAVETLIDSDEDAPDPIHTKFLQIITKNADRLNSIIEDLLTLSRIEQEPEASDSLMTLQRIEPILEAALDACEDRASQKSLNIDIEVEPQLMARLNAPLFQQVCVNLIDNAIKYSDSKKDIVVRAYEASGHVVTEVEDYGIGIPSEHLSQLFDRFYRVDKARSRKLGGTGLGLSIVQQIVERHEGSIEVDSQMGHGTRFIIKLPSA